MNLGIVNVINRQINLIEEKERLELIITRSRSSQQPNQSIRDERDWSQQQLLGNTWSLKSINLYEVREIGVNKNS
jgi:hypothetical protein